MHQPPHANCRCQQKQTKHLVTPVKTALFSTPRSLGFLLIVWLDARFNHRPVLEDRGTR